MAKTLTCAEALKRHQGLTKRTLHLLLLREEIKAKKVHNIWHIPVSELDRVFGG